MKVHIAVVDDDDDDDDGAEEVEEEEEEEVEEEDVMIQELFLFCGSSCGTCKLHRRVPPQILLLHLP